MGKITSTAELREAIQLLEIERTDKLELLKAEANQVIQRLKPENIIANSIQNALHSTNLKENLIDGAIGLVTGYLSKKVLIGGGSNNPIKNILGNLIQFGVTSLVTKNADEIKASGRNFIKKFFSKKQNNPDEDE